MQAQDLSMKSPRFTMKVESSLLAHMILCYGQRYFITIELLPHPLSFPQNVVLCVFSYAQSHNNTIILPLPNLTSTNPSLLLLWPTPLQRLQAILCLRHILRYNSSQQSHL